MSITNNIKTANQWLKENRKNHKPITLARVQKRLTRASLLSIESDAKTTKGSKQGYLTGILYFAPHKICGINLCPMAKTCVKDCLFNAGRGRFTNVSEARIIKTLAFFYDRERFTELLRKDIKALIHKAKRNNQKPVIRLNGTSDITIEKTFASLLAEFRNVQFYDYTKNPTRFKTSLPRNYDLTFSYDGTNMSDCLKLLKNGYRVAAVFKDYLPSEFMGFPVVNGDNSDLRFLDNTGVIVGLIAKGLAKKDTANQLFIINPTKYRKVA